MDVQLEGSAKNLTGSLPRSPCAPQLSDTRATGCVVRARTATRKIVSNQDLKWSPSIHAFVWEK